MDMIFEAFEAVLMVVGSLSAAATLCWLTWSSCIRLGIPQGSGLIIGNIATVGLLLIPHGSFLTLMLAYAAAAAFPVWMAGKVSFHRNIRVARVAI